MEDIQVYHINHDIGKPYCIQYDEEGKPHYPNHSEVSYQIFKERYGDGILAELVKNDMGFHACKGEELEELCKLPFAQHLYATAWAELFANAELFGGTESTSFKIKRKKLIKAFKHLIQHQ